MKTLWLLPLVLMPALLAQEEEVKPPVLRILLPEANAVYGKHLPIQVEVEHFRLTNDWSVPGEEERLPVTGAGHLQYVLDNRPLMHTDSTRLVLEDLPTAEHILVVTLVGHDHIPVGPEQRVIFKVVAPRKGLSRPPLIGLTPE
ncbi:hypothetical protein [Candidatus Cyanaurora vandensis]|uniref:hypothetical protein n=1 Tax=Candidatus Cyanaurora vandensis TaxID=2714958 RepID=UPI00257B97B2|nr:hypothetical protein [Candidatus Cyanaurora vandensis]